MGTNSLSRWLRSISSSYSLSSPVTGEPSFIIYSGLSSRPPFYGSLLEWRVFTTKSHLFFSRKVELTFAAQGGYTFYFDGWPRVPPIKCLPPFIYNPLIQLILPHTNPAAKPNSLASCSPQTRSSAIPVPRHKST